MKRVILKSVHELRLEYGVPLAIEVLPLEDIAPPKLIIRTI